MVREAVPEDANAIRAFMKSIPGFWDTTWRPDVVARVVASSDAIALVHEDAGKIEGFACIHDLGFRGYLSELVVSPGSQHKGIGSQLLSEAERRLAERGCSLVIGDVWRDAEGFYRSHGWTPPPVVLLRKRFTGDADEPAVAAGAGPRIRSVPGR